MALVRRLHSLELRQRVEPNAMTDLELARRVAFVCAVQGRDLLGEVAPACSRDGLGTATRRSTDRARVWTA